MDQIIKQSINEPLYPNILWNRPISRQAGGQMLIVGGRPDYIGPLQAYYELAWACGLGVCKLAVPDSLSKLLAPTGLADFLPSTPNGALAKSGLGQLLALSENYDAVLLAPAVGNNSETSILLRNFLEKTAIKAIICADALSIVDVDPKNVINRSNTLIICTVHDIYKIAAKLDISIKIKPGANRQNTINVISLLAQISACDYAIFDDLEILIKVGENLSTTPLTKKAHSASGAILASMWLQSPTTQFEGLTTAAYLVAKLHQKTDINSSSTALASLLPKLLDI